MSSLDVLNAQIKEFLKSKTAEVLCIRGPWGVGKTHAWDKAYEKNLDEKTIALQRYSKISLFGMNTLDDLKLAICQNHEMTKHNWWKVWKHAQPLVAKTHKPLQDALSLVRVGNSTLKAVITSLPSATIICMDDLERRGKNLSPKDVMGLISHLKEQKKCKVVLILNDEKLEEFKEEFDELKEKVIDVDINFEPSVEDIGTIAFENYTQVHQEIIKTACRDLDIKNIRIIEKIKALSEKFMEVFNGNEFDPQTMVSPLRTLALASLSEYGASSKREIPTIDFLKQYNELLRHLHNKKKNEPDDPCHTFLQKYGYRDTDDLDKEIIHAVQRGYFDKDALKTLLTAHNQAVVNNTIKEDFYESWRVFHDSFNHNEQEVVENLYEACKRCMKAISIGNIDGTICTLRPLGYDDKADDLIAQCVTEPSFTHEFFDIDALPNTDFSRPRDEKFIKAIQKRYQELKPKKSLREALKENAENALSSEGMKVLQEASADAYYDVFKNENGPHLGRWIEAALRCQWTAPDGITHTRNNVEKALQKIAIAGESKLNEMRMEKFNIPSSKGGNL
jgi:hypothetical protein